MHIPQALHGSKNAQLLISNELSICDLICKTGIHSFALRFATLQYDAGTITTYMKSFKGENFAVFAKCNHKTFGVSLHNVISMGMP